MKKSCLVIGGLFLLLLTAGIATLVMRAPQWWEKGAKFVQGVIAEQERIERFESDWTPKSNQPDAAWAPAALGEWKLIQTESVSGWPDLKVTRPGQRMVYENGGKRLEIGVVAANDLEKEVLIERIVEAAQQPSTGNMTSTRGNQTHVRSGPRHTRIWWLKNWLFFFRSTDVDPDVGEAYLNEISASPKAEVE